MYAIVDSEGGGVDCEGDKVVDGVTEGRVAFRGVNVDFHLLSIMP